MAVDTSEGNPNMDYPAHERTYVGFIKLLQYGTASLLLLLVAMAIFLI